MRQKFSGQGHYACQHKLLPGNFLLILCLVLLTSCKAHSAQQNGDEGRGGLVNVPEGSAPDLGQFLPVYSESHALVIGASAYKYWRPLPGVQSDVTAVAGALKKSGFTSVQTLLNPDTGNLDRTIRKFVVEKGQQNDARLLIYFAGHGHTRDMLDGKKRGYIVPVDAPLPSDNEAGFNALAMPMQRFQEYAYEAKAKHILFVFDSCFSGSVFTALRDSGNRNIDAKTSQPVRQFLTAGTGSQQVPDISVFRRQFVEAIDGAGDLNRDGFVTGSELHLYLEDQVMKYTNGTQTPRFGALQDPSYDKGDFVFALAQVSPRPSPPPDQQKAQTYYNPLGMEFAVIPAGSFLMGDQQGNGWEDELPVHRVTFAAPFSIMTTEVSVGQWQSLMQSDEYDRKPWQKGEGKPECGYDQCPMSDISREQIFSFLHRLNEKSGRVYRLPSEAEWEYAARAGADTDFITGTDITPEQAAYGNDHPKPVRYFLPNRFGLFHVHGNAHELVQDCVNYSYVNAPIDGSAWLEGNCFSSITRGGSYWSRVESSKYLRLPNRAFGPSLDYVRTESRSGLRPVEISDPAETAVWAERARQSYQLLAEWNPGKIRKQVKAVLQRKDFTLFLAELLYLADKYPELKQEITTFFDRNGDKKRLLVAMVDKKIGSYSVDDDAYTVFALYDLGAISRAEAVAMVKQIDWTALGSEANDALVSISRRFTGTAFLIDPDDLTNMPGNLKRLNILDEAYFRSVDYSDPANLFWVSVYAHRISDSSAVDEFYQSQVERAFNSADDKTKSHLICKIITIPTEPAVRWLKSLLRDLPASSMEWKSAMITLAKLGVKDQSWLDYLKNGTSSSPEKEDVCEFPSNWVHFSFRALPPNSLDRNDLAILLTYMSKQENLRWSWNRAMVGVPTDLLDELILAPSTSPEVRYIAAIARYVDRGQRIPYELRSRLDGAGNLGMDAWANLMASWDYPNPAEEGAKLDSYQYNESQITDLVDNYTALTPNVHRLRFFLSCIGEKKCSPTSAYIGQAGRENVANYLVKRLWEDNFDAEEVRYLKTFSDSDKVSDFLHEVVVAIAETGT